MGKWVCSRCQAGQHGKCLQANCQCTTCYPSGQGERGSPPWKPGPKKKK